MDLRLSSAALSGEPTTPPDRRSHARPPIYGGVSSMTSPILSSFSPACSPGRSHVHGEYEARLYSPASATSGNATPSSTLGPAAAASVGIGFRDSFVMRTPPRRFGTLFHVSSVWVASRRCVVQVVCVIVCKLGVFVCARVHSVYSDRFIPSRSGSHFDFCLPLSDSTNRCARYTHVFTFKRVERVCSQQENCTIHLW
jgi:hypothetical protein